MERGRASCAIGHPKGAEGSRRGAAPRPAGAPYPGAPAPASRRVSPCTRWIIPISPIDLPIDSSRPTLLYDAAATGGPQAERLVWSEDGNTIYFKSHAANGEASIWEIAATGGPPRLLVDFNDLSRSSARLNFEVGSGYIYYAIEEQRSDVSVLEINGGAK